MKNFYVKLEKIMLDDLLSNQMYNEEFDQISETSIERIGVPGVLIPMSQDTRVVLGSDNLFNVIIVTTRFGQGQCVNNCKQWLSKEFSNKILDINTDSTILLWSGHNFNDDEFTNDLILFYVINISFFSLKVFEWTIIVLIFCR